jgi:hypothetical protein
MASLLTGRKCANGKMEYGLRKKGEEKENRTVTKIKLVRQVFMGTFFFVIFNMESHRKICLINCYLSTFQDRHLYKNAYIFLCFLQSVLSSQKFSIIVQILSYNLLDAVCFT